MKSLNESHDHSQTSDATKPTKKCTKCGELKSLSEFHKDKRKKTGKRPSCRTCDIQVKNRERDSNPLEYKSRIMYKNAKYRAKKKGIAFSLELSDIHIPELCPCLGVPFEIVDYKPIGKVGGNTTNPYSPSLDRIDNRKGYTPDNIWVVSHLANCIMSTCTDPEQIILTGKRFKAKLSSIEREKQMELDL